ncbi:stage II sporulation protein M, partial [Candidatus Micrarchaeota archaeon]|nr:stage II sporulation protein M [Candidatus Micrarchaeota archaeon]
QLNITGSGTGFLVVAFICIAAAPFMVRIFDIEEAKSDSKKNFLGRHEEVIQVFAFFFVAVIFASSLFFVLTGSSASSLMFGDQTLDLCSKGLINDPLCAQACSTGALSGPVCAEASITGNAIAFNPDFMTILINNLTVLALAILFSLILGAGAVFLISWNATVIGVLIAKVAETPEIYGSVNLGSPLMNYVAALPITLLRILPHGIFEFGGYFFGAVAGGILSVSLMKMHWESFSKLRLRQSFKDALIYFVISLALIVVGAVVEVGI